MKACHWIALIALAIGATTAHAAKQEFPEVDSNGLHLQKKSDLRVVYKLPGATLDGYDKVILVDAYVAFQKDWAKEHEDASGTMFRLTPQDIEGIKQRVAAEFHREFVQELEKRGYTVVDKSQTGKDVLIVRPALINLDVEAPDTMKEMGAQFVRSAGDVTLYAELYDSVSSQMLGKVIDPEADRGMGGERANRVTNKEAEDRIVKRWADTLAEHMDKTVNPDK